MPFSMFFIAVVTALSTPIITVPVTTGGLSLTMPIRRHRDDHPPTVVTTRVLPRGLRLWCKRIIGRGEQPLKREIGTLIAQCVDG